MRIVMAVRDSQTSKVGLGQRLRFLLLTKRSTASGDKSDDTYLAIKNFHPIFNSFHRHSVHATNELLTARPWAERGS